MKTDHILLDEKTNSREIVFTTIGATEVTGRAWSWLPLSQLISLVFFTRQAARRKPDDSVFHWAGEGILKTTVILGSEWCHNLAHTVASNLIGKPMDQLRIQLGMPRCIYHDINDLEVSPRQHVMRSLGGPIINILLLPVSWITKKMTRPGSISDETAKAFYQTNLFLSLVSLLPIPGIDGGALLKWSLVEKGFSVAEADQAVRKTNGPLAVILGLFSSISFAKKRTLTGVFSMMMGLVSLSIFAGWLKEEDISI
jgi:Zn-dependent protease